jgi:hypothetical protein
VVVGGCEWGIDGEITSIEILQSDLSEGSLLRLVLQRLSPSGDAKRTSFSVKCGNISEPVFGDKHSKKSYVGLFVVEDGVITLP